jgi:RNA polymerase sigma-70 factor (ECF subfamily)
MAHVHVGSTDAELLRGVAALRNQPAWCEFYGRYDPAIASWCGSYGFDRAAVDELRQRVWVELAQRLPTYHYDPSGSFRGWLRRLCHYRAIDLYRERRGHPVISLDDVFVDQAWTADDRMDYGADDDDFTRDRMLREAREAQEVVRQKVKPVRWEAFWRVVIEGESIDEAAAALGVKYATAYAAARHVAELLRAEGKRRQGHLHLGDLPAAGRSDHGERLPEP